MVLLLLALLYGPYQVNVVRVIDGDTIEVDVSIWPGLYSRVHLRLSGVNTPEKRGTECEAMAGKAAMRFTQAWLKGDLTLSDVRPDKYGGRVLGRLNRSDGADLGEALIKAGHGRVYKGGKRAAWCY